MHLTVPDASGRPRRIRPSPTHPAVPDAVLEQEVSVAATLVSLRVRTRRLLRTLPDPSITARELVVGAGLCVVVGWAVLGFYAG